MLGARRCRSTALTSFRRWPSATPTSVARPPVGSGCSAPSQSRRPNLTTGPPTPRRGWSTPNRKSLIGCLASFRGSRSSSIPASSFKWLRMVRTSFQTQLSNLAPSDVNKLLDGSTYPGWKMNCTAYKKIWLVRYSTGYHLGPAPPRTDGASLISRNHLLSLAKKWRQNILFLRCLLD